jgi:hypothetical protein
MMVVVSLKVDPSRQVPERPRNMDILTREENLMKDLSY